ncbi:hypothetical protein BVX98_04805 [bacterium F11]|nr:hypothetical protein BVX98_04805 [bacterium F11]
MKGKLLLGFGVFFIFFHLYLGSTAIKSFSPTYDEPVHLTAGYVYWKTGDFRFNGFHHPPFGEMWAALPLMSLKPLVPITHPAWLKQTWSPHDQYQFADTFLFRNRVSHETLMKRGRWMQMGLSVLLGVILCWMGYVLAGPFAAFLAMGFWSFSPTFLAHGTLVSTDLSFSFFYFCFFVGLLHWRSWKGSILAGLSLGLCLGSKFLAIALFPTVFVLLGWMWWRHREIRKELRQRGPYLKFLLIIGVSFLVLLILYQGDGLPIFWGGLKRIITRAQSGRSSYFLGEHQTTGWALYFPFLFLFKTPLPLLLGFLSSLVLFYQHRKGYHSLLVIPPLLLFVLACGSKVQIGHRHILAVYPFLILFAAVGLSLMKGRGRIFPVFLLGWLLMEMWFVKPHFLSYFNEMSGGPKKGYQYVTDSNVDWGQGLKLLSQELDQEDLKKGIFLSYFGVADPNAYGIAYIDVGSDAITGRTDHRERSGLHPTKLAISVTHYQATYFADKNIFAWLKEKEPSKKIGHSIFLYDFKDDPSSLKKLMMLSGYQPEG